MTDRLENNGRNQSAGDIVQGQVAGNLPQIQRQLFDLVRSVMRGIEAESFAQFLSGARARQALVALVESSRYMSSQIKTSFEETSLESLPREQQEMIVDRIAIHNPAVGQVIANDLLKNGEMPNPDSPEAVALGAQVESETAKIDAIDLEVSKMVAKKAETPTGQLLESEEMICKLVDGDEETIRSIATSATAGAYSYPDEQSSTDLELSTIFKFADEVFGLDCQKQYQEMRDGMRNSESQVTNRKVLEEVCRRVAARPEIVASLDSPAIAVTIKELKQEVLRDFLTKEKYLDLAQQGSKLGSEAINKYLAIFDKLLSTGLPLPFDQITKALESQRRIGKTLSVLEFEAEKQRAEEIFG